MSKTPQLSSVTAMNHLAQIGDALRANRTLGRVPPSALVWPAGLDRSILQTLPLSVRTWNCLIGARLIEGDSQLRAVELLHLPNFGNKSLWDLLNNVETFLLDCAWKTGSESTDYSTQTEPSPWVRCGESLLPLLATSAELLGTKTLAEALHPDLLRLASRMGLSPELQAT